MKKGFLAEQWYKYRRKKTILGILFDFLFTLLVIAMLFPTSRKIVSSTIIRYSLFQPRESKEITYLNASDFNWQLEDLDGNIVDISTFKGKPILLNFWATWCPPCLAEMPSLQRLYDEYGDRVAFVLASQESLGILRDFMAKKEYTMPVYVLRNRVPDVFASRSIPATFLISPQGQVLMKKQGAARWDGKRVKKLLNELLGVQ